MLLCTGFWNSPPPTYPPYLPVGVDAGLPWDFFCVGWVSLSECTAGCVGLLFGRCVSVLGGSKPCVVLLLLRVTVLLAWKVVYPVGVTSSHNLVSLPLQVSGFVFTFSSSVEWLVKWSER